MTNREYWLNRLVDEQDSIYRRTVEDILGSVSDMYLEVQQEVLRELVILRARNLATGNTARSRELLLEETLAQIEKSIMVLAENTDSLLMNGLQDTYMQTYMTVTDSLREVGVSVTDIIPANIEDIIKSNWSGATFSERIWHNRDTLMFRAKETLSKGLIRGESYHSMASEVSRTMSSSYSNARRLVETEVQVAQIKANVDNYKNNDIDKVEISAILDQKTCSHCNEHDGEIVNLDTAVVGGELPPYHPMCRCTTIPVIDIDDN